MRNWRNVIGILFTLALVGCASASTPTAQPEVATVAPSPTTEVTNQPTRETATEVTVTPGNVFAQPTRIPTTVPTAAPTFAANLIPAPPLTEEGALLVFPAMQIGSLYYTLWSVRAGGAGLIELTPDEDILNWAVTAGDAPGTGILAYSTQVEGSHGVGLTLTIMDVPSGNKRLVLPLTNDQTAINPDADDSDELPEISPWNIFTGINHERGVAWSPNGTQLAFVGAMNGTSADVYLYDRASGAVTQITSGDAQASELHWSPDGRYIAHFAFHAVGGGGFNVDGLYVAKTDGSGSAKLPDHPAYTPDMVITFAGVIDWLSNDTVLVWDDYGIRSFNMTTSQTSVYGASDGRFAAISSDGVVVAAARASSSTANDEGVYWLQPDQPPTLILDGFDRPIYVPSLDGFLMSDYIWSVDSTLTVLDAPPSTSPIFSPDGTRIAWGGIGLWFSEGGQPAVQVLDADGLTPIWTPDSSAVFFFDDDTFYRMTYPNSTPQRVGAINNWHIEDAVWLP